MVSFDFCQYIMSTQKFFSGGGISGLCLAVALTGRCPDIAVSLYEATDRFKEIGAVGWSIILKPRTIYHSEQRAS
jgi:2-polyprenyl-6-methoxyphenol hydroxylase-like FAD-dependent oxidoreductase